MGSSDISTRRRQLIKLARMYKFAETIHLPEHACNQINQLLKLPYWTATRTDFFCWKFWSIINRNYPHIYRKNWRVIKFAVIQLWQYSKHIFTNNFFFAEVFRTFLYIFMELFANFLPRRSFHWTAYASRRVEKCLQCGLKTLLNFVSNVWQKIASLLMKFRVIFKASRDSLSLRTKKKNCQKFQFPSRKNIIIITQKTTQHNCSHLSNVVIFSATRW